MSEHQHEVALRVLEQSFGDRVKPSPTGGKGPGAEVTLTSVMPMSSSCSRRWLPATPYRLSRLALARAR
jgi:hypothetical protein